MLRKFKASLSNNLIVYVGSMKDVCTNSVLVFMCLLLAQY